MLLVTRYHYDSKGGQFEMVRFMICFYCTQEQYSEIKTDSYPALQHSANLAISSTCT